jgi:hypothetical protein
VILCQLPTVGARRPMEWGGDRGVREAVCASKSRGGVGADKEEERSSGFQPHNPYPVATHVYIC